MSISCAAWGKSGLQKWNNKRTGAGFGEFTISRRQEASLFLSKYCLTGHSKFWLYTINIIVFQGNLTSAIGTN